MSPPALHKGFVDGGKKRQDKGRKNEEEEKNHNFDFSVKKMKSILIQIDYREKPDQQYLNLLQNQKTKLKDL